MKIPNRLAQLLLAGVATFAALLLASPATADNVPQVVQVVRLEGNAQFSTDGRTWQDVKLGDVYQPGTVIKTQERSLVDVSLGDAGSTAAPSTLTTPAASGGAGAGGGAGSSEEQTANVVRIFESTIMAVDRLSLDRTGTDETSETQLDLRAGQIMTNVKKLSSQSHYEVKIPNGVAGIRGNCSLISSSARCACLFGSLRLALGSPDNSINVYNIGARHWFDPGTLHIDEIPADRWNEFIAIYDELCALGFHLPPIHFPHNPFHEHHSDIGGTSAH